MGSSGSARLQQPSPTPTSVSSEQTSAAAEQSERRRIQQQYGRSKTILAGAMSDQTQDGKRTLLGGA